MLIQLLLTTAAFASPSAAGVCDDFNGQAFGQCNAYCEAMDCDANPNANQNACDNAYNTFFSITGEAPPCEVTEYDVRVVYSGDDSITAFADGAQIPFGIGDNWWSYETEYQATLTSGTHDFAFHVWDVGNGAVGLGAFVEVDGVIIARTDDNGSFVATGTDPGVSFSDPGFDDSTWAVANTCSWHPWNSANLAELTATSVAWAWPSQWCAAFYGNNEAWFRTKIVLP